MSEAVQGYPYPNIVWGGGVGTPSVSVKDLWEVYPGLAGGEPADFAKDVAKAAEWGRGHEKLHRLRDRFEDAAIESVAEMGLFECDNKSESEEK
jgi:hypothetical protein